MNITLEETCLLRLMRLLAEGKGSLPWGEAMIRTRNGKGHSNHLIMKSLARKGAVRYDSRKSRVYFKEAK